MYYLYSLRDFILIIAFFALIIGLIRPSIVIHWGTKRTRGRVLLYYGLGMILLTVIPDLVKPEEVKNREIQESVERMQKREEQKAREQEQKAKEKQEKEKERQEQLQQAQPILDKAKQHLNSARDAYKSGYFVDAIVSAQRATSTLKSISHIPEAFFLDKQATNLLSEARVALANAPDYVLSANQLIQEYNNNEVAADNKYNGKIVLISGIIRDISKGMFDTPRIKIGGKEFLDGLDSVRCYFTKDDEPSIARLYKGQHVKIRGKVTGMTMGNVQVKDCTLQ